jgi:hypothetical protein
MFVLTKRDEVFENSSSSPFDGSSSKQDRSRRVNRSCIFQGWQMKDEDEGILHLDEELSLSSTFIQDERIN